MSNSIDTILELLTSDKDKVTDLKEILINILESQNVKTSQSAMIEETGSNIRLQQKINLIKAMIPLLSSKNVEYAQFIIKLLTMMSVLQNLKYTQN
jgi:hypothetical protein